MNGKGFFCTSWKRSENFADISSRMLWSSSGRRSAYPPLSPVDQSILVECRQVFQPSQFPFELFPLAIPSNITAPPNELSTTNIPVCCVGVQLNLANPGDPTDVRVLVDGTLHPANQVTRNGSFLYIMGLQAGTEYPLNITLSNILGTVWVNTTVRPLLGEQLVWAI